MILIAELEAWLHAPLPPLGLGVGLDPDVPVLTPDLIDNPEISDRAIFAFPTTGPGPLLEQLFTVPTFGLRARGQQYDYASAEGLAKILDDLLLTAALPASIGGRHVPRLGRTGGEPTFLFRDTAGRSHFTCNYYFEIAVS